MAETKNDGEEVQDKGEEKGDDYARRKLVDNVVNTSDEQMSSMTNLQPNLVTPLAMTETYEELTDILKRYVERYQAWQEKHEEHLQKQAQKTYYAYKDWETIEEGFATLTETKLRKQAEDKYKELQKKDTEKQSFYCSQCIEDGVEEKSAKLTANNAHWFVGEAHYKGKGGGIEREVSQDNVLCFEHAIRLVERVEWGPRITPTQQKEMDAEEAKVAVHLTRIYRMSLYKHRRSVGGVHRMAAVDLAKQQMELESQEQEDRAPDYEE